MVSNEVESLRTRKPSVPEMRRDDSANGCFAALGVLLPALSTEDGGRLTVDSEQWKR